MLIANAARTAPLPDLAISLIPYFIIIVAIYAIVWNGYQKNRGSVNEQIDRNRQHMQAVEDKLDRVIDLLEKQQRN